MGEAGSIRGATEVPPLEILTNDKKKNVPSIVDNG